MNLRKMALVIARAAQSVNGGDFDALPADMQRTLTDQCIFGIGAVLALLGMRAEQEFQQQVDAAFYAFAETPDTYDPRDNAGA